MSFIGESFFFLGLYILFRCLSSLFHLLCILIDFFISKLHKLLTLDLGHVAVDIIELPVSHFVYMFVDGDLSSGLVVLVVNDGLLLLDERFIAGLDVGNDLCQIYTFELLLC